jgi:hypothetical protein
MIRRKRWSSSRKKAKLDPASYLELGTVFGTGFENFFGRLQEGIIY